MPQDKDPMELPDDFFVKDEQAAHDEFMSKFQAPVYSAQPSFEDPAEPKDPKEEEDPEGATPEEIFKFDDSLAEAEKAELAELNAKFDTNYTDLKELKNKIKSVDNVEDSKVIESERQLVNYFNKVLEYDDERILFENEKMEHTQNGGVLDKEALDAIKEKIEDLKANNYLKYAALAVRNDVKVALEAKNAIVNKYDNDRKTTTEQTEKQHKEAVQESISTIFKAGKFLGVQPTKQDMVEIYQDIIKNKHIDHLKSNPTDAVEFALFRKYRETIMKNSKKPGFNDGVKSSLEEIGMKSPDKPIEPAKNIDNSEDEKSYFARFAQ